VDLYLILTPQGPALCKHRYLVERQLDSRPDAYRSFTGPLSRMHAVQYLAASFPTLWPNADFQVNALVVGVQDHQLLTFKPQHFPLEAYARTGFDG
jgi:hypothetical protein